MVRTTNCVAGSLQHSTLEHPQHQETDSFSRSMVIFFFLGRSLPVLNLVIRLRMHMSDLSPGLICTPHQPFPTDCACCVQCPDSLISLLCLPPTELMIFHLYIKLWIGVSVEAISYNMTLH